MTVGASVPVVTMLPAAFCAMQRALRSLIREHLYYGNVHEFAPHADIVLKIRGKKIVKVEVLHIDPGMDADASEHADGRQLSDS